MNDTQTIKNAILELALQLEKLHKVVLHSDPSAEEKKKILFEKYQTRMLATASRIKEHYGWDEIKELIAVIEQGNEHRIEKQRQAAVFKRLTFDLEQNILEKPVLTEFKRPPAGQPVNKEKPKVTVRRYVLKKPEPEEPEEPVYTKEKILEMVHKTQQKRLAASNLKRAIAAIKNIGPENIEVKIIQSLKPEDE